MWWVRSTTGEGLFGPCALHRAEERKRRRKKRNDRVAKRMHSLSTVKKRGLKKRLKSVGSLSACGADVWSRSTNY